MNPLFALLSLSVIKIFLSEIEWFDKILVLKMFLSEIEWFGEISLGYKNIL